MFSAIGQSRPKTWNRSLYSPTQASGIDLRRWKFPQNRTIDRGDFGTSGAWFVVFVGESRYAKGIVIVSDLESIPMDSSISNQANFERFRPYLLILARGQIPAAMQARLDASDIVQETLLEAHAKREEYRGSLEPNQIGAWLRKLLSGNLIDAIRRHGRDKRNVQREWSISQSLEETAQGLEMILIADQSTPSEVMDRKFMGVSVAEALERLPEQYRVAIELRYLQGETLDYIATKMGRSKLAVAGILKRALATLRDLLKADPNP